MITASVLDDLHATAGAAPAHRGHVHRRFQLRQALRHLELPAGLTWMRIRMFEAEDQRTLRACQGTLPPPWPTAQYARLTRGALPVRLVLSHRPEALKLRQGLLPTQALHLLVGDLHGAAGTQTSLPMKIRQKGTQQAIQRCLSEPCVHITSQAVAAEEVVATGQLETVTRGTVAEADLAVVRLLGG